MTYSSHLCVCFSFSYLLACKGLLFRARYLFVVTFLKLEGGLCHRRLAVRFCSKQATRVHSKTEATHGM
jgi:hypothetical protein